MTRTLTLTLIAAPFTLAACGETEQRTISQDEAVMIQKGTYVYNPNARHAPVSISGEDLYGLEPI